MSILVLEESDWGEGGEGKRVNSLCIETTTRPARVSLSLTVQATSSSLSAGEGQEHEEDKIEVCRRRGDEIWILQWQVRSARTL